MGLSAQDWLGHLLRHPAVLPEAALAAARQVHTRLLRKKNLTLPPGDPEMLWYDLRYNWMLAGLETEGAEASLARALTCRAAAETHQRDAYSCANRIGNLVYLMRHLGSAPDILKHADVTLLLETAHADANFVARNPEFNRQEVWFSNHLLNNYRSLCLYRMALGNSSQGVDIQAPLEVMEGILYRHLDTLFDGGPVLQEGSVSYEVLILKHVVDIACCGRQSPLADLFRDWAIDQGRKALLTYRKDGEWLLPQAGDLTPDLRRADMLSFLDGYALKRPTAYRKVWEHELSALGL